MEFYICEDNQVHLSALQAQLMRLFDLQQAQVILTSTSPMLLAALQNASVDAVVLLDIALQSAKEGIFTAQEINRQYPSIPIIFLTSYLHLAIEVGEAQSIYFLVKPVSDEKLVRAVQKAQQVIKHQRMSFHIRGQDNIVRICDILYIERIKRMSFIHTHNNIIETAEALDDIIARSHAPELLRCHKSFAVNVSKIKQLTSKSIMLEDGSDIPISRASLVSVKDAIANYLGGLG